MVLPDTVNGTAARGACAGPAWTEPSLIEYLLPWHGHSISPLEIDDTMHP